MTDLFILLPKAKLEVLETWQWYEKQRSGLGDEFKSEVYNKINRVVENPLHYPVKGKYREAKTAIFPFLIVYRFDKRANLIFIVSVFHTSRHPKRKRV